MNKKSNSNTNNKKFKNIVEEIKSDPQKKAWFFLAGYFIFFLIIILMLRTNYSSNSYDTNTNSNLKDFSIYNIKKENYHFKYTVSLDQSIITYEGEVNNSKSLFNKNNNGIVENYYKLEDTYYNKVNGVWTISNNPYILSSFTDIEKIEKILENAKYISKTEYEDYTRKYNYQISTTTLVKLIDNEIVDLDDIPNDIFVTTDESNKVQKIEFNISSYTNYKLLTTISSNIVIEYSNFDEIGDIDVELN